ncbi:MAG: DNA recombination protein RmuC [Pseudomonadota bacterium]
MALSALVAGGVAFFYRGKALEDVQNKRQYAEAQAALSRDRLDDALAALHTQAAKAEDADRLRLLTQQQADALSEERAGRAALEARMAEREAAVQKELQNIEKLRTEMQRAFAASANEALHTNRKAFLDLANETFAKHSSTANADLEARRESIAQMLSPVKETLKRYEEGLGKVEQARQEAYGALTSELKNVAAAQNDVRQEAAKLSMAMRASPKARGKWGEHQLQRIMELSGMAEYVDFATQVKSDGVDTWLLPDATLYLPGDRTIVVDAKASMNAYLDALDAPDDGARDALLTTHARQVKEHIKQLSGKRYWEALETAPDFVVMFLPNENLFSAALDKDPDLLDFGLKKKVLIATPTTFMALAKSVAYGWRQENMAQNAKTIAELGQELYKRMSVLGNKVAATGKNLDKAVGSFNDLVGSIEGSVLPQARKFRDLEIEGTGEPLPELPIIETDARQPAENRDLLFEATARPGDASITPLPHPSARKTKH